MCDRTAPRGRLRLEWVHGYRGNQCRNNLFYTASKELVYFTAAVCVVYNPREHTQRFYHTHTADVISLCLHPGRAIVASGQVGPEPLVCVWDTYSTSTLSLLQGTHQHGVSGLSFSSDGELLVSVGLDQNNTVCVWDWRLGRVLASAVGHTDRIFDVSWSPLQPHRLVTCGVKHIKFWSLIGSLLSYKRGVFGSVAPQTVLSLALKDDITFSGTLSGDVLLWRDTSLIRTVASAHTGAVFSLQTSDLQGFVSGGRDGCVRLWDQDFNPINRINLRESAQGYAGLCVRAVCWRGERLVAGSQDGEVFEVLVRERDQPRVLVQGHSAELWGLDTHPKQQVALTGSDDCSIRLWSLQDHRLLSLYKVQSGVRSVAFHPDGSVLALGQKDGSFTVLRLRDMSEVVHIKQSSQVLHELKFSPDAALLAVGCNDGSVHVYATSQRYKRLCTCGGTMESFITHLDWSVDSRVLLTNDGSGTRSFYRMPSGKPVALEDLGGVQWMTWTGVVGSEVNGIWPKYGSEVDAHSAHANPSCALLATAHANGHVRLYRYPCTRKGAKHKRYGGHSAPVTCVRWSSDLQWLLSTGGADHSLFQWRFVPESTMGGALEPLLQEPVMCKLVYSRDDLLVLRKSGHGMKHPIPREIKKPFRGNRAGARLKAKKRRFKPAVPSIMMGNVNSYHNKCDELAALVNYQREFRESSLLCLTETWLTDVIPDIAVELPGFTLVRADRDVKSSGKSKGGGLAIFVNNRWCHPGHISAKERLCCKDIELLAVGLRPYYVPREFNSIVAIIVYIPPRAEPAAACDVIHDTVVRLQTLHPDALFVISGDFNHVNIAPI